eukprot:9496501-Pyramimonas_sp.AAC.1
MPRSRCRSRRYRPRTCKSAKCSRQQEARVEPAARARPVRRELGYRAPRQPTAGIGRGSQEQACPPSPRRGSTRLSTRIPPAL